jgi:hypothetical protein
MFVQKLILGTVEEPGAVSWQEGASDARKKRSWTSSPKSPSETVEDTDMTISSNGIHLSLFTPTHLSLLDS